MIGLRLFVWLGAILSFSMEPLVGRLLLPEYGGAFYVWATTLMFFQGALFVGYAYAHLVAPRLGKWHLLLLAVPLAFLPFGVGSSDGAGVSSLLGALGRTCGVPFAVLASTSVMAQRWLAQSSLPERDNPYPLYSASNLGSLGALLIYVLVGEPLMGMQRQSIVWASLYVLYVAAGVLAYRGARPGSTTPPLERVRPAPGRLVTWMLLAAGPSALSLAVTNIVIVEIGNAPLLWVLPLALYLLSFIFAFGTVGTPPAVTRLMPHFVVCALGLYMIMLLGFPGTWFVGATYMTLVFVMSWAAHGALYAERPPPAQLTTYYLALALGGWIGGAFVAVGAPLLFDGLHEFVVAILLTAGVMAWLRRGSLQLPRALLVSWLATVALLGVLYVRLSWQHEADEVVATHRSPYGVYRVVNFRVGGKLTQRRLDNGQTTHGIQRLEPDGSFNPNPIAYYVPNGSLDRAIDALPRPRHIGVVGLGVGAIAGLTDPGDRLVFYEIDPSVTELARTHFGYLASAPDAEVRTGDARRLLALEARANAPRYQMLIIDAFTGDGVPAHLLTTEALKLYLERVEPGAAVLLHVSSRFLPLHLVIGAGARAIGTEAVSTRRKSVDQLLPFELSSHYAAIGNVSGLGWAALSPDAASAWTDDRSSLLPLWLTSGFER